MADSDTVSKIASILCQIAQIDLALMQVEHQLTRQGISANGPTWRAVRGVLAEKKRGMVRALGQLLPSALYNPEDLFRVVPF